MSFVKIQKKFSILKETKVSFWTFLFIFEPSFLFLKRINDIFKANLRFPYFF
jgi:hypothetical protein